MSAVNRPEPGLWITLAAIPANGALVYVLMHGKFGVPELGIFGAGLATTLVSIGMFGAALWFTVSRRPFRKYHVLGGIIRIDWPLMWQLFAIGAPISVAFLLEYGLFGAGGLLMGLISTTALTAHQIALQIAAILFMVPFGVGMAATVRVGHALGREDAAAVRRAGYMAMLLGIAFMFTMTLAVIAGRFEIAAIFLGAAPDSTMQLAATLLLVGSTFFIADGIQTVAAGALRGLNDTRVPLLFATISYWLVGFTCAAMLGFHTSLGPIGVWVGLSCGTAVFAVLLVSRFHLLSRRALPTPPQAA
jgi:MATE family multidrug resistance protein